MCVCICVCVFCWGELFLLFVSVVCFCCLFLLFVSVVVAVAANGKFVVRSVTAARVTSRASFDCD